MANAIYPKFKEQLLQGGANTNLSTGIVKACLIDRDQYGVAVTTVSNALPMVVVTASPHGLTSGMLVSITGVTGNTAANGLFKVANMTSTSFELTNYLTGASVAPSGSYSSGGRVIPLGLSQYLGDIPSAARVAISAALTGKTFTNGVFKANTTNFSTVSGAVSEAVAIFVDSGNASTSPLVAYIDTNISGAPITPNGGDIALTFDGTNGIFGL